MKASSAFLAAVCAFVAAAHVTNSNQVPLGFSDGDGQKPIAPSKYWYESILHNGEASFMPSSYKSNYSVFRNVVTEYGADNTGNTDASGAIQKAINAGAFNGPDRTADQMGTTGQPAIVYLPAGTYKMAKSLQLYRGTVLLGDATQLPTLKAVADFPNDHIIYGKDPHQPGTNNFMIAIKNIVLDSNNVDPASQITLLDWTVSQATQLTNVIFEMPNLSTGHKGLTTQYNTPDASNSNVIMNDLTFNGGAIGMDVDGQQWLFKGMNFNRCTTGMNINSGFNVVVSASTFTDCFTGINATGASGSLTLLDSNGRNVNALVRSSNSHPAGYFIILENIKSDSKTVVLNNNALVTGDVSNTWVHGDVYFPGSPSMQFQESRNLDTPRPSSLLVDGKIFTMAPPTYGDLPADQVINVKRVAGLPVFGNGIGDDTANINSILAKNTGKVIYFPAGTYSVSNTITIPPGSRVVGDAYASYFSAIGDKFSDASAPLALVQLGKRGDIGVGQISDMIFTVADVLPGCKLLEVNMAGAEPGDVGIWNSHMRVGGAAGTLVRHDKCPSADPCKAAWGMLHLTDTSSAYIENMWGWTADHDIDGGPGSGDFQISVGRGALIEATKGTWLVGTAMEHNTLYQFNFNGAANVASVFQQSETPYWQGPGNILAPAPWNNDLIPSDPNFSNCDDDDAKCRMAWFERISGCTNLFLYGGCDWVFFNNNNRCGTPPCQENGIDISDSHSTYLYGTNVFNIANMIRSDGKAIAKQAENVGGFAGAGGVVAAYLFNSL